MEVAATPDQVREGVAFAIDLPKHQTQASSLAEMWYQHLSMYLEVVESGRLLPTFL